MFITDDVSHPKVRRLAAATGAILSVSLLFGCGPSETSGPVANSPSPSPRANGNEYSIGQVISFATDGNSAPYKVSGWSDAEPTHSWTNGVEAVLALRIPATTTPLTLKMKMDGSTKIPEIPSQPVEVYANGEKIADWDVRGLAEYSASIPSSISTNGGLLTLTLKIPKAFSPRAVGSGQDPRVLGLACVELSLTPAH
jgi:hypothetical protein